MAQRRIDKVFAENLGLTFGGKNYALLDCFSDGLTYIIPSMQLYDEGFSFSLDGYEARVYWNIRQVEDTDGSYERLWRMYGRKGISNISKAVALLRLEPLFKAMEMLRTQETLKHLEDLVRGRLSKQGERDLLLSIAECYTTIPEVYKTLLPAMIRSWRALWKEEFPFLFVQIAPLEQWMDCCGKNYVEIRKAQQHAAETIPDTGMAVITDVGMQFDIHPKKKQPVGHRLALLAENKVYGDGNVLCEAPSLKEIQVEEGKVVLTFDNAGDGLYLTENVPYGQVVGKETLGGLRIFQNGQELKMEKMKATARKNHVIVTGAEIRSSVPTQVRLAQTGWYLVNLYNSAGIPARPAEVNT